MPKIKKTIRATLECIRYPFLYPRHRITGLHYNNWKLHSYYSDNYPKAVGCVMVHVMTDFWFNKNYTPEEMCPVNNIWYDTEYDEHGHETLIFKKGSHEIGRVNLSDIAYRLTHHNLDIYFKKHENNDNIDVYIVAPNSVEFIKGGRKFYIFHYTLNWWIKLKIELVRWWHLYPLQWFHCLTSYTEWDNMRALEGWYKAFGDELLTRMAYQIKKDGMWRTFRITDIKEKYGSLRIYTGPASREMFDLLNKYDDISFHTCIYCGKPATKLTGGYIIPLCDECYAKQYDAAWQPLAVIGENGEWKYIDNEHDTTGIQQEDEREAHQDDSQGAN